MEPTGSAKSRDCVSSLAKIDSKHRVTTVRPGGGNFYPKVSFLP